MQHIGTWLTLIGAALALCQSVWVIVCIWYRRNKLRTERDLGIALKEREAKLKQQLEDKWGSQATYSNFEELPDYRPDAERDRLRAEYVRVTQKRVELGWSYTWGHAANSETPKMRELREVEEDWKHLWRQGALGLIGGIMALVGAVLLAIGST